jgi:hypothetical protein
MGTCPPGSGLGKCEVCNGQGKQGSVIAAHGTACDPKGSGRRDRCKGTGRT